jgi:hypothetical protein
MPIVVVQMPPQPTEEEFYTELLLAMNCRVRSSIDPDALIGLRGTDYMPIKWVFLLDVCRSLLICCSAKATGRSPVLLFKASPSFVLLSV